MTHSDEVQTEWKKRSGERKSRNRKKKRRKTGPIGPPSHTENKFKLDLISSPRTRVNFSLARIAHFSGALVCVLNGKNISQLCERLTSAWILCCTEQRRQDSDNQCRMNANVPRLSCFRETSWTVQVTWLSTRYIPAAWRRSKVYQSRHSRVKLCRAIMHTFIVFELVPFAER